MVGLFLRYPDPRRQQHRWGGGHGARFCRCNIGIDDGTGDHRYCSLGRTNYGGNRWARVIHWNDIIGRGSGGDTVDRRYCCPCCVGGEGG